LKFQLREKQDGTIKKEGRVNNKHWRKEMNKKRGK
jgi:hypothetical protein